MVVSLCNIPPAPNYSPQYQDTVSICLSLCTGGGGTEVIDATLEETRSQRSALMALKVS